MHAESERWLQAWGALKGAFFELASDRKASAPAGATWPGFLPEQ